MIIGYCSLIAKSLKLLSLMDLSFHYELTKEEINLKAVSLQIVMTWYGNNVYAYACVSL